MLIRANLISNQGVIMEETKIDFLNARTFMSADREGMEIVHKIKSIAMGFHENIHELVFTRKFRFLLIPDSKPEIYTLIHKVKIDYASKTLTFVVYDFKKVRDWLKSKESGFSLETYDGCGTVIWSQKFSGLSSFKSHVIELDMSSSDTINHEVTLTYEKEERTDYD